MFVTECVLALHVLTLSASLNLSAMYCGVKKKSVGPAQIVSHPHKRYLQNCNEYHCSKHGRLLLQINTSINRKISFTARDNPIENIPVSLNFLHMVSPNMLSRTTAFGLAKYQEDRKMEKIASLCQASDLFHFSILFTTRPTVGILTSSIYW